MLACVSTLPLDGFSLNVFCRSHLSLADKNGFAETAAPVLKTTSSKAGRCSKEQRRSLKWPGLRRRPVRRSQRASGGHQSGHTILALVWSHFRKDNGAISTRSRTCTTTGSMRLRLGGSMRWVVKSTATSLGLSAQDGNIMVRV